MRIIVYSFLLLTLMISCDENRSESSVSIQESNIDLEKWLNLVCERKALSDQKMIDYEVDSAAIALIKDYYFINPEFKVHEDSLITDNDLHPFLQGIKVDLDHDQQEEVICFVGSIFAHPSVIIYAKQNGKYSKIFQINLWLHNIFPTQKILESNNASYKLFRTGEFHSRGSGYWIYMFYYFKKIGNQIQLVLQSPYRSNEDLNIDWLNASSYLINDTLINEHHLQLSYEYESRASFDLCKELDLNFDFEDRVKAIENKNLVIDLKYDSLIHKFEASDNSIKALIEIENDTLQWKAFSNRTNQQVNQKVRNFIRKKIE